MATSKKASNCVYQAAHYLLQQGFSTFFRGEACGKENIPKEGPFIIAANHVSFLDPPFLGACIERPLRPFARDTLFKGVLKWLLNQLNCIAIKREADSDVSALKQVFKTLKDGEGILLFPEGTRSANGKLQPPKRGVGMIACKAQVPVIPTRIFGAFEAMGRNSKTIDFNSTLKIVYGKPIAPDAYDPGAESNDRYLEASERVMEAIAKIEKPKTLIL